MRKVNLTAEVVVNIPVRVKINATVIADDGASLANALRRYIKADLGKTPQNADLEDLTIEEIVQIGIEASDEDLPMALETQLMTRANPSAKVEKIEVTDSR